MPLPPNLTNTYFTFRDNIPSECVDCEHLDNAKLDRRSLRYCTVKAHFFDTPYKTGEKCELKIQQTTYTKETENG